MGDAECQIRFWQENGGADEFGWIAGKRQEKVGIKGERAVCAGIDETHDINRDLHDLPGTEEEEGAWTEHMPPDTAVRVGGVVGVLVGNGHTRVAGPDRGLERIFDFVLAKEAFFH